MYALRCARNVLLNGLFPTMSDEVSEHVGFGLTLPPEFVQPCGYGQCVAAKITASRKHLCSEPAHLGFDQLQIIRAQFDVF